MIHATRFAENEGCEGWSLPNSVVLDMSKNPGVVRDLFLWPTSPIH